jgi:glycosyltransferase involved in cell wall biosynthesis
VRVALLTEIPAPYRIPLFNALAAEPDVELRVLFLAERDPRRPFYELHRDEWRFDARVLGGRQLRRGGRWLVLSRGVGRELRRFQPHAVAVGGWNQPAFWSALLHTRARRIPLLVWIESTLRDARSEARALALARRAMAHRAAGAFVPGRAAAEFARSLGLSDDRIALAPNAIDNGAFAAPARRPHDGPCSFLYAGRLDPEKGLDVLLEAFRTVPGELELIGTGSDEERLRRLAPERVRFTGPLDRDALIPAYGEADVFVLPSRSEPWGMVLNEAAAAGLPLVATEGAGAAHDLIEDGVNGFRVPVGDAPALAAALTRLAEDPELRRAAGLESRRIVAAFTPESWARGVAGLARRTAGRTTP